MKRLFHESIIDVRFHEVDALDIVWHGHYIKYFEIAREAFGEYYGMGYRDLRKHHTAIPVVSAHCEYKRPLKYGDQARVKAQFIESQAAKIIFKYEVYNHQTTQLVASGQTIQVFTDPVTGELFFNYPDFYQTWLDKLQKP